MALSHHITTRVINAIEADTQTQTHTHTHTHTNTHKHTHTNTHTHQCMNQSNFNKLGVCGPARAWFKSINI